MHYVTLATVEIPHIEEEEELNAKIAEAAEKLEAHDDSDIMKEYFLKRLQSMRTSFSRAVSKAVDEIMDPFCENTDDPQYLEFEDYTDEVEDSYNSDTRTCVRLPEGRVVLARSHEFRSKYTLDGGMIRELNAGRLHSQKRTHKAKKLTLLSDYPVRKLYPSIKDYAEEEGYCCNEDETKFGYMMNPNGQWDWYSIGGRWSDVFLVSDQCKEYSLGECGRAPREVPEGYIWVSAARKKDIEWDAMRSWRKEMAIKEYEMLKSVFETKKIPDGTYCRILEDGARSPSGREYLSGETEEDFLARYGLDGTDPRYPDCFYNYISGGEWFSSYGYAGGGKDGEDRKKAWHDAVDEYIASLSDDTVLVVVDCHS